MPTIRFQEVKYPVKRRVECAGGCGKKLTRQTTLTQTINPFNKNADGSVRTYSDIWRELRDKSAEWKPEATCPACSNSEDVS